MKKFVKICSLFLILGIVACGLRQITSAADEPDAFIVDITPSSFEPNSPVDMTIKAVKGNGQVVSTYEGDVYIDVIWSLDSNEYVVPSDHLYTFAPQDQWVKLFSKGLIIKKAGTYTVQVSDIINDSVKGEKTIIVGNVTTTALKSITIDSPVTAGIEKNPMINILWSSTELPNSPFQIWINNIAVSQGITDANGWFNAYASGLTEGTNTLQVKILDIKNTVLGESKLITFAYAPIADGVYNSIQILPSTKIAQGTKVTFIVSTNDAVSSAELILSNGASSVPMEKDSPWVFKKEIVIDTAWEIEASVNLIINGQTKSYNWVATLTSEKSTSIGKVRIFWDPITKSRLNITWETIWEAAQYKILYGTGEWNLLQSVIVNKKEIVVDNLLTGQSYFFKIIPLDANGAEAGMASAIIEGKAWENTQWGVACVVKWIIVSDVIIWDKHYLIWSGVVNVVKYVIYRSDFETTDVSKMNKIAEVADTRFEYPFNKNAKKERFEFFVVEAVCSDGNGVIIDNVKKVNTGPVENILLFVVLTLFFYTMYKLYFTATSTQIHTHHE